MGGEAVMGEAGGDRFKSRAWAQQGVCPGGTAEGLEQRAWAGGSQAGPLGGGLGMPGAAPGLHPIEQRSQTMARVKSGAVHSLVLCGPQAKNCF